MLTLYTSPERLTSSGCWKSHRCCACCAMVPAIHAIRGSHQRCSQDVPILSRLKRSIALCDGSKSSRAAGLDPHVKIQPVFEQHGVPGSKQQASEAGRQIPLRV